MTTLQAHPREVTGKKVKLLRQQGLTPVHLYGKGTSSAALQVETATLRKILVRVGKNRPVSLKVDGSAEQHVCFVREIQFDPLNEQVQHVDFLRVDINERMEFRVPIRIHGEAPAVRNLGGTLVQVLRDLAVEALPLEVPGALDVDVSALATFDMAIRAKDLPLPGNVTLITDEDQVIIHVVAVVKDETPVATAATAEAAAPAESADADAEGAKEAPKK